MKQPTVQQARAICEALKARAVIVIALDASAVSAASYGETKLECRQTGYTLDCIVEAIEQGNIPTWETPK